MQPNCSLPIKSQDYLGLGGNYCNVIKQTCKDLYLTVTDRELIP